MNKIIRAIPNTITSLNLLFGCIAIVFALRGWTDFAVYCIFAAAVCDFCDGLSARLVKAYSELGKQLDSLADVVSFGVAPAALLHKNLESLLSDKITGSFDGGLLWELLTFFPFVVAIFSALRLAKFNIDTRQSNSFIGLPVPANALLLASLVSLSWITCWPGMLIVCIVSSTLLVCNLPMFALKLKNLRWSDNKIQYIFLLMCLLIVLYTIVFNQQFMLSIALIFSGYIAFSFCLFIFSRFTRR